MMIGTAMSHGRAAFPLMQIGPLLDGALSDPFFFFRCAVAT
jgi:hypothetical protein